MIRILHVSAHENLFHEYHKNFDNKNIIFDYVLRKGGEDFKFKSEIDNRSKLYYLTPIQSNWFKFIKELRNILKSNGYKYVHLHLSYANIFGIIASMGSGVKIISHNHSTYKPKNFILSFLRILILKPIINLFSDQTLACSIQAGNEMFYKYKVIPNSINYEKFSFSQDHRDKIRTQFNISDDTFLIGHVGHFMLIKNHDFFINLLKEINPNLKIKILLVGIDLGTKLDFIKKAKNNNLFDYFIIHDYSNKINEFYSAFDIFILPSFKEGLPLSLLEAQVNGLKCFYSNTITSEVKISEETKSFDINNFSESSLIDYANKDNIGNRFSGFNQSFNIKKNYKKLQEVYTS